jgi:uncharacterized protein YifE (UPF0438 family)
MEFNTGTGVNYSKNCQKINDYVRKMGVLNFCYTDTRNRAEKINSIQNQLAAFETELFVSEQQALLAIKEKYQISNEIWQKYMADLHRMKTIYTKSMQKSHPDAIHDPNIPADILEILITLLQQNGINPHNLHLKMADQKEIDKYPNRIAQAADYISYLESSKELTISYTYEPSSIELFPQMTENKSITDTIATCAHEIQHIIQHHSLTKNILIEYLNIYYNITYAELKKTPEFNKLAQIHEAQAEILSAIADPKIAECLKIERQETYYPDRLYEEHFFQLAHIDMLWKTREWLENYHQYA